MRLAADSGAFSMKGAFVRLRSSAAQAVGRSQAPVHATKVRQGGDYS